VKEIQATLGLGSNNAVLTPGQIKPEENAETLRAVEKLTKLVDNPAVRAQDKQKEEADPDAQDKLFAQVKSDLAKLNDFIPVTATNLSFEFDDKGNPPFIRVIDKGSDEVIREIPSEEFREVAKALEEFADKVSGKGLLFDRTA
jgi:uncharacterized FlaG/YvyC family protein